MLNFVARGSSLVLLSILDYGAPFVRMWMMSHTLALSELGLASVLVATVGTYEAMTDFTLARFVYSTPRNQYHEALAAAHALSILRGTVVGLMAFALAPFIAAFLSVHANWFDFALLGFVVWIRSFENIAPRIAERDYRYGVQVKLSLATNGLSLAVLAIVLHYNPTGTAVIASMLTQVAATVVVSHFLADAPYRVNFRSPLFKGAFRFGYPLLLNGIGLAASSQGDRFIVASMLGLSTLGVYAIATLATFVPTLMVNRFVATVLLAALYNGAEHSRELYVARLRLAATTTPVIAAIFALGIITLYNIAVPIVFGHNFTLPPIAVAILAVATFFRMARGEPFTTMLMNQARTRRIAIINMTSISSLVFVAGLIYFWPTIEATLMGKVLGEAVSLGAALIITSTLFRSARRDYVIALIASLATVACAIALSLATDVGVRPVASIAALVALSAALLLWTWFASSNLVREGFPRLNLSLLRS